MELNFYTFESLQEDFKAFTDNYEVEILTLPAQFGKHTLKVKGERVCRFCGIGNDASKFIDEAHIIPELLGNKDFFSDSECDECNHYFGKLENDLTKSLGILRTLYGTKGKNGIPTFKSPQDLVEGRKKDFFGAQSIMISSTDSEQYLRFNNETGEHTITYIKQSYTPLNVYKALLKIAYTILPEKYIEDYGTGFGFLKGNNLKVFDFAKIGFIELPVEYAKSKPIAFLFKRKSENTKLPTHSFALYYENLIYTFPIFFNNADKLNDVYNTDALDIPLCPPLFFTPPAADHKCRIHFWDLNSTELKKGEKESVTMKLNKNDLKAATKFNPRTGEFMEGDINGEEIAAIYLIRGDQVPQFFKAKDE